MLLCSALRSSPSAIEAPLGVREGQSWFQGALPRRKIKPCVHPHGYESKLFLGLLASTTEKGGGVGKLCLGKYFLSARSGEKPLESGISSGRAFDWFLRRTWSYFTRSYDSVSCCRVLGPLSLCYWILHNQNFSYVRT